MTTPCLLYLEKYTDKSFIIHGQDTILHKEQLKSFGARYNPKLKAIPNGIFKGGPAWIFPWSKMKDVSPWIEKLCQPKIEEKKDRVRTKGRA